MLPQNNPLCWGKLFVQPGWSFFPWSNWSLRGGLSMWCCAGLGKRKCHQNVAISLTLLMHSVLVFEVREGALISPHVLGFAQWCLVFEYLWERMKEGMAYVIIFMMPLSVLIKASHSMFVDWEINMQSTSKYMIVICYMIFKIHLSSMYFGSSICQTRYLPTYSKVDLTVEIYIE